MLTARQTKEIARQISDPTDAQDISIVIENLIKEALAVIELQANQGLYTTTIVRDIDNSTEYVRISWN